MPSGLVSVSTDLARDNSLPPPVVQPPVLPPLPPDFPRDREVLHMTWGLSGGAAVRSLRPSYRYLKTMGYF